VIAKVALHRLLGVLAFFERRNDVAKIGSLVCRAAPAQVAAGVFGA
jgi:hypothetical protein